MKLFILSYVIKINPIFLGNCITTNRVLKNIVFIFMKYQTAIVTCLISYDTNHSEYYLLLYGLCAFYLYIITHLVPFTYTLSLIFLKLGRYGVSRLLLE